MLSAMVDEYEYCRQVEAHLCRKNAGHLIRIVGPAFELVRGWAQRGVPLKIALRGIDKYCERYDARGGRRRPVRIEFCEADILQQFDAWRRAIGVSATEGAGERPPRRPGLAAHIERVVARLNGRRGDDERSPGFRAAIDTLAQALSAIAPAAAHARGQARSAIVDRLAELDRDLLTAAGAELDAASLAALKREAEEELATFGSRMPPDARERAVAAATQRQLREHLLLPTVSYE